MIDQYFLRFSYTLLWRRLGAVVMALAFIGSAALHAQDDSRVRAVQLVPDAPAVDVYLDDATPAAISGINYLDASRLLRLSAGTHNVKIAATGTPKELAVINQNIPFNSDTAYTIFATGRLSTLDIQPVILTRWLGLTPTPGRSLLRVLHGSREAGDVNIMITDAIGAQTELNNVQFRSASDYVPVPEGALDVVIRDREGEELYRASGIIPQGALMTIVAVGDPSSKSFKLGVLFDSDSLARSPIDTLRAVTQNPLGNIRFAQVSSDLGTVDITLQSESEVSDLNFRDASAVKSHAAGTYQVAVMSATGEPQITKDVDVIADFTQTAYIVGSISDGTADLVVLTTDGSAQPPPGRTSIRFLNTVPGVDLVNVEIQFSDGSKREINSSGFRNFVSYQTAPPGLTSVKVTTADGASQLLMASGTIPSGTIGTLILNGSVEGGNLGVNLLVENDNNAQIPMILFQIMTGVESHETLLSRMEIAPNPVRDRMTLRFSVDRPTGLHYSLYDMTGRTLMNVDLGDREVGEHIFPVSVEELASGSYMVVLQDDAGRTLGAQRLVVL